MAWLDDRIRDHPKIRRTSAPAFKVWALALCYCSAHGTAGQLDDAIAALSVPKRIVDELVTVGLWDREADGLWVHDWQEHNEKRDEAVEERRKAARERQRRHRERVRQSRVTPRDESVTVTRDSDPGSPQAVTRDSPRGRAPTRARDQDHDQELQQPQQQQETHTSDPRAAAAAINDRLHFLGLPPVPASDIDRAAAWLNLADQEADRNPAGYVKTGLDSGNWPSTRARKPQNGVAGEPLTPDTLRELVRSTWFRLPPDELEYQLTTRHVDDDLLVELLDLAADLQRGGAGS